MASIAENTTAADLIFERAVVGGVCTDGAELPPQRLRLAVDDFTDDITRALWSEISPMIASGDPIDQMTVSRKLLAAGHRGMCSALSEMCYSSVGPTNLYYYAGKLLEIGNHRRMMARIDELRACGDDQIETVARDVIALAQCQVSETGGGGLVHIREPLRLAVSRMEKLSKDPDSLRQCKTGLADVDALLYLEEGALTVIGARPGMGKTAFAGMIARHTGRDITRGPVALFSLEMSSVALVTRMISSEARTDARRMGEPRKIPAASAAIDRLMSSDIWFDDRSGLSVGEMSKSVGALGKVRVVVVDYLQLAKAGGEERQDLKIGAITKGLKALAKDHRTHVIALSQLNRAVEKREKNKRPMMSDLRDAGAIEEDADNVLFLYRDDYYDKQSQDKGTAEIIIAKQRNGATGTVRVAFSAEYLEFSDLSKRPPPR